MANSKIRRQLLQILGAQCAAMCLPAFAATGRPIAYITPKLDLPFWRAISNGVASVVAAQGDSFLVRDSNLSASSQLQHTRELIAAGVAGIVISPTDSASAQEMLELARKGKVPVVIADIGTNGGEYVSYIKSDNYRGAYDTGTALALAMKEKGWNGDAYGLVTISLARKNGQDRTNGFRDAMNDAGVGREVGLRQMQTYSAQETEGFVNELLKQAPDLRALFIETDQPVEGALQALKLAKRNDVLIVSFDAMPQVEEWLSGGKLVAVGMQQPYLMGLTAAQTLLAHLRGAATQKQILVPILVGTRKNIHQLMPQVKKNVFGQN